MEQKNLTKKLLALFALLFVMLFIGIRMFNHYTAWGGILFTIFSVLIYIKLLNKIIGDKENEE